MGIERVQRSTSEVPTLNDDALVHVERSVRRRRNNIIIRRIITDDGGVWDNEINFNHSLRTLFGDDFVNNDEEQHID